ncbi:hypothetical protein BGZ58_005770, partial [Dissophora ornata]
SAFKSRSDRPRSRLQNDYGNGIHNLGVKTNIKVIRTLLKNDASVQDLVQAYLDHATVSRKLPGEGQQWSIESFADALNVFVNMNQPVAIPQPTISATDSATGDSSIASQLFSRMDRVLILNAEYKKAMCEARKTKRADRAGQSLATKNNATNPFLTIDKPNPNQRHKYQPRYTPK